MGISRSTTQAPKAYDLANLQGPQLIARIYQRTAQEIAAGVTPVDFTQVPGLVDRYLINTTPGTTDMGPGFNLAASCNEEVSCLGATYFINTPIVVTKSCRIRGTGFKTMLLAATQTLVGTYSQNIFTCTTAVDHVSFTDLTLNGNCAGPSHDGLGNDNHEIPLVKIVGATNVIFERVKMTGYCAAFNGTNRAISQYFFQGITVQNASLVIFKKCLWQDNHYEMCSVWNGPTSDCQVLIEGCTEINTAGTPDSHTAFETSGGHTTVNNCLFLNTGKSSNIAIQVPRSVRITNCTFKKQAAGATTGQIEIGQDTWPFNGSISIENNYLEAANGTAISVGQGASQVIRGNIINSPTLYGIKLTNALADAAYTTAYPISEGWSAVVAAGSNSVVIENNVINAATSGGIFLHTVNKNNGLYYKGVTIKGNHITSGLTLTVGMVLDDMQDSVIEANRIEFLQNAIVFESLVQNLLIDGNTTSCNTLGNANADIIWTGNFSSHDVRINRNNFSTMPSGQNFNVLVFAGTVANMTFKDNINMNPRHPVDNVTHDNTIYDIQTTRGYRVTGAAAPAFNITYNIGDRFPVVPATGQPIEYICTTPGTKGSAITATAAATATNNFFTPSAIGQFSVNQVITIAGAGAAGAALTCVVSSIDTTNNKVYIDDLIVTTVGAGAVVTLVAPVFVKSGNYT